MSWFVYILLCDSECYYIGITHDLSQRLISHKNKRNLATKEFSQIDLIYSEQYKTRSDAERREKQLKGWSKVKKQALIEGKIELLKKFSKNHEIDEW